MGLGEKSELCLFVKSHLFVPHLGTQSGASGPYLVSTTLVSSHSDLSGPNPRP